MGEAVGEKIAPSQVAHRKGKGAEVDKLIHGSIDKIIAWEGPATPVEQGILLSPMHGEVAEQSKQHDDGLEGYEEADEQEQIDQVNVLVSDLKRNVGVDFIELALGEV